MRAEIISSGTELLLGEVIDTNTPYLARELAAIGVSVYHHTTVGDNPKRLLETIKHAESRANLVIISGGLGPTQDDITKNILAKHLDLKLLADEESFKKIKNRYHTEEISAGNHNQSLVIEGSKVLKNEVGMAAGMFVEKNEMKYALLPGPPSEFEHMASNYLIPLLLKYSSEDQKLQSRNLNFYGLPEAVIAEELKDLIENQSNPTIAIYAKKGVIDIRITVSGSTEEINKQLLDETEAKIMDKIGENFFGYNKTKIRDVIFRELDSLNQTISVIELNMNSQLTDFWTGSTDKNDILKAAFNFLNREEAQKYFEMDLTIEQEKNNLEQNESLAYEMSEELATDYVLAVSSWGEIKKQGIVIPKKLYISIIKENTTVLTKEVEFTGRTYFADWVIPLKVSDIVRRYLLSIGQLEN